MIVSDYEEGLFRSRFVVYEKFSFDGSYEYSQIINVGEGWMYVFDIVPYEDFNCTVGEAFESK